MSDGRLFSPSARRNLPPIMSVLREFLPDAGQALEIASGTGEHSTAFAAAFPGIDWRPTDADPTRLASIDAWRSSSGVRNVAPATALNVEAPVWPIEPGGVDAAVTVNLLHLLSDAGAAATFRGVGEALRPGGQFFVYGPFSRDGAFVSTGDAEFHAALVREDPTIGYKDASSMRLWAATFDFDIVAERAMPANNLMFVFRRAA